MTDSLPPIDGPDASGRAAAAPTSAGALLRAAREREGLHLAVLAATIKVTPAKLQALEQDRYDELPNATFTRALAQSVCRSLKIDPRPVLALLPQVEAPPLEGSVGRLNAPFQERSSRRDGQGLTLASKPMFWAGGLLLLAAVVVGLLPSDLFESAPALPAMPAASAPAVAASVPAVAPPPTSMPSAAAPASAAPPPGGAAAAESPRADAPAVAAMPPASSPVPDVRAAAAPPAAGLLGLRATADSWIEVVDAQEQVVFSRVLRAGESTAVDGRPPLRVRIGNAGATEVTFRGQPVDLAPYTRVNVARLDLR
jgi:cytoskeleton protein RodZ